MIKFAIGHILTGFFICAFMLNCNAQISDFNLNIDSIPHDQYVRFLYNPKGAESGPLAFDLYRSQVDTYYLSYALPIIWHGIKFYEDEPMDVHNPLLAQINALITSGEWIEVKSLDERMIYPDQFGAIRNPGVDPGWDSLFMQIFNDRLLQVMQDAIRQQHVQLATWAKVLPGCYRVYSKSKKLDRAKKIRLVRSTPDLDQIKKSCYWCFLRDRVVMSGPCTGDQEVSYFWELRQIPGNYTLCLYPDSSGTIADCSYEFHVYSFTDNDTIILQISPVETCNPQGMLESPALLPARGRNANDN